MARESDRQACLPQGLLRVSIGVAIAPVAGLEHSADLPGCGVEPSPERCRPAREVRWRLLARLAIVVRLLAEQLRIGKILRAPRRQFVDE